MKQLDIYLEVGKKKVFAGVLDWPGWCRSGPTEEAALEALIDYAARYRGALGPAARGLTLPRAVSALRIVERLKGSTTTDFGAPGTVPAADGGPVDQTELAHLEKLLRGCWAAFDASAKAAGSKTLTKGPRGGGRNVPKIKAHVVDAEWSYLYRLGGKGRNTSGPVTEQFKRVRAQFLEALSERAAGELPDKGPRGGKRWGPRYAVRRSAWHSLDHAWEIEDRAAG